MGAVLLTPSKATFGFLMRMLSRDPGNMTEYERQLAEQTILGRAFGAKWQIVGAVNQLCTSSRGPGMCLHRLAAQPPSIRCAANGSAARGQLVLWVRLVRPAAVSGRHPCALALLVAALRRCSRNELTEHISLLFLPRRDFRPPIQTIKRGLEGKSKKQCLALLRSLGSFSLHFVATKPWAGDSTENDTYAGAHALWWEMHNRPLPGEGPNVVRNKNSRNNNGGNNRSF